MIDGGPDRSMPKAKRHIVTAVEGEEKGTTWPLPSRYYLNLKLDNSKSTYLLLHPEDTHSRLSNRI